MSLEDLRKKIDDTDAEITRLIAERIRITQEVGAWKKEEGVLIEDVDRERIVLENIRSYAREEKVSPEDMENIYRQVITASKRIQGVRVAFQGEAGAYSEEAAYRFFGSLAQTRPCKSLEDVFKAVQQEEVPFGIVPVENSLEGSINQTYDLLLNSNLKVSGEIEMRIVHCLIVNPGVSLHSIKRVYSHPQALAQCQAFLKHMGYELIPTYDTAGSVKMIKEAGIADSGAVASARAAEVYGMNIVAREIEDNQNNFTRFFILSERDCPRSGRDKTSIVFSVSHKPGALYGAIKEFAARDVSLTRIESRPTRQKPWEYNFYLDVDGHREDTVVEQALASLEKTSLFVKVLGSFPRAKSG